MAIAGDALLKVTGAYRINYAIMGNSDPYLHAHVVPRYSDEPVAYLHDQPWSYPEKVVSGKRLDAEKDRELAKQLAEEIARLKNL